jgi:PKD domain
MKAVAFSKAGTRILVLSVIAAAILAIAGCGFSYNSGAVKSTAASAIPVITCSANPASVLSGNSVQISAKASSPLGLPLSYSYGATAGSIASDGASATLDTQGTAGSVTVTCKVVDTMGNAASSATTVTVQAVESQPPTVSCSANPAAVTLGGSVAITADASSPEGRPLTYTWSASSGTISGTGNVATLNTSGAAPGTTTVTCKVADNQGLTASATTAVTVNVVPLSSPPIIGCSANPQAVTLGGTAVITAIASSPEGRPLTYSWSASSGTISGTGNVATLNTSGAAPGTITVTCKVADNQGLTASGTTAVTVNAVPLSSPPIIRCSANPQAVTLGGTAVITATASSPEGQPLTYSWSASSGTISGNGNTATLNTSSAAAGTITVTCKVADDQGRSATATTVVTVNAVHAAPPTISCSANPSIMNQGGTAVITATGRSPQNLPLTYSYSASAGSISGTSTTANLETSRASAGIVTVTCTVDQQGGGTASATTSVLLQSVTGEQALTNFQFTDSVGVNVHLAYGNTVYASQFPLIMQSMISLGVKHYRDGLNQYAQPFQYQNAEMLGKAGIKADWLMDLNNSASIISSAYTNAPDATAEFEGPNEDDAEVGPPLLAFMQLLNATVRGNPATAAMPIIAPSFTQPSSFAAQGNLSSLINFGNMHDYFGNRNPETAPDGGPFYNCGDYGSMQFDICLAQMIGVNEPVLSTETGYESGVGLSDAVIGRYELRILFESLRLGVMRTFLYEFIDDPSGNWGLLTESFSPRPAYTAIQNVLSLLKDASFAHPGKLDYTLSGNTQNVHQVLLQKSDGTFYLAIWLAVQDADPNNPSTSYDVASQDVTLSATTPIGAATTYVLDDSGNMASSPADLTSGSLPIVVTDRITLVALSPGQSH